MFEYPFYPIPDVIEPNNHPASIYVEAYLDGVKLPCCVQACPSQGWAVVIDRDLVGNIIYTTKYGVVKVYKADYAPEWVSRYFPNKPDNM